MLRYVRPIAVLSVCAAVGSIAWLQSDAMLRNRQTHPAKLADQNRRLSGREQPLGLANSGLDTQRSPTADRGEWTAVRDLLNDLLNQLCAAQQLEVDLALRAQQLALAETRQTEQLAAIAWHEERIAELEARVAQWEQGRAALPRVTTPPAKSAGFTAHSAQAAGPVVGHGTADSSLPLRIVAQRTIEAGVAPEVHPHREADVPSNRP